MEIYISEILRSLFDAFKKFPAEQLIGSSGLFDTLADVVANDFYFPEILEGKTEFTFN